VSLAWELTDLAVAGRVHGAVDPDHVACGDDGVAVLLSRPTTMPSSTAGDSATSATDVAGWGQTVAFAATRRLPPLGSCPVMQDVRLAGVIARTIAELPQDRPDSTELELLLADLEVVHETDVPATPEDAANLLVGSALMAAIRREEQALRLPGLAGSAPDDLLGMTALGPVVRVFVTHLRFWALLAGVSLAVGAGLIALGSSVSRPIIWSPGLALTLVGVAMMPWLVRFWGMAAVIYENGFGLKKRTRRWTARWEDLVRLRIDVRKKPKAGYATVQIFGTLADGGHFHVPRAVFGRETLMLAAVLDRRTFLHRLSSARDDLQRGQRDFGPVRLTRAGVTYRSDVISWHELTRVERVPHNAFGAAATALRVVGRDATHRTETFTVPEYRVWDSRVLLDILEDPPQWPTE
jgi:hypothetical protein